MTSKDIPDALKEQEKKLELLFKTRQKGREPIESLEGTHPLLATEGIMPKTYHLVAQGDSWFDYPGDDLINYLRDRHGHKIDNIAVAGSTLNDIVYGPVPKNWLGIPQSDDVSRIQELHFLIWKQEPVGVLLSGGGNDIAGPEFFQLINNALSSLENPNTEVVQGIMSETFKKAYQDLIREIVSSCQALALTPHIFVHGYDHPFPDGRGVTMFNVIGPWFHDTFNKKNYPLKTKSDLRARYEITRVIIDSFNEMLASLEIDFPGVVHHVDLRGILPGIEDWANELHPTTKGFERLSDKFNLEIHKVLG
ncbi:MAG: hypothetical protein AB7W16_10490 [Candidatus Obscuribacterales bacterium]